MKKKIINHGQFLDTINYDALIEAQANTPTFLDSPKGYSPKVNKNYNQKHLTKKLVLSHKKVDSKKNIK